ncbi:DUF928 domain-containing protein [Allocoleopsis franciscana]|uniref:DUF928 domain-containing protein n=1 Tax=Allocoleopsis franciscana PCC 7113 TaxID=1173027 RepID=K9WHQ0_9CYAN|nr:DUF928 domain-containing protein [Allocoleopsis franciscana]AFZ19042.1 protein of unknown function (DUF928) [Allocoleopsis franciscana PCC 7113]
MVLTRSLIQKALVFGTMAALVPTMPLLPLLSQKAQAQSNQRSVQLLAKRPLNAGNTSSSGAVRGECPAGTKNLKALNPEKDPGNTTQGYPTFWFYVPFGQNAPQSETSDVKVTSVQFELQDDTGNPVLTEPLQLALPDEAGIVKFTLPSTEKALEVGKDYYWRLSIICDPDQPSANPSVAGWLTRIPASAQLDSRLKATPPQQQYLAYKENNLWFEYVTGLASNRTNNPSAWSELVKLFDLQEFATTPVSELRPESGSN